MRIPQPCEPILLGEFLRCDQRFPAVYFLHDDGEVVYVGQSTTLRWRIETHLSEGAKTFDAVSFIPCCVSRLREIEGHYIRELAPTYNQCGIANRAREEDSFMPEAPRVRVVNGESVVGSLGLSRLMDCSREFAKGLIALTGKTEVSVVDAIWFCAHVREPAATQSTR